MSLIKKIDVEKYFAARRGMRLGKTGPLNQFSARMKAAAEAKKAPAAIAVDAAGHLPPGASVAPIPIVPDSGGPRVPKALRNRQA
jgi:hypothetical protein